MVPPPPTAGAAPLGRLCTTLPSLVSRDGALEAGPGRALCSRSFKTREQIFAQFCFDLGRGIRALPHPSYLAWRESEAEAGVGTSPGSHSEAAEVGLEAAFTPALSTVIASWGDVWGRSGGI